MLAELASEFFSTDRSTLAMFKQSQGHMAIPGANDGSAAVASAMPEILLRFMHELGLADSRGRFDMKRRSTGARPDPNCNDPSIGGRRLTQATLDRGLSDGRAARSRYSRFAEGFEDPQLQARMRELDLRTAS